VLERPTNSEPFVSRTKTPAFLALGSISNRSLALRCLIFVLLVAVASLSTRAKNSVYTPRHDSVHYLSIASKMKSTQSAPALEQAPLRIVVGPRLDVLPEFQSDIPENRDPEAAPLALFSSLLLRSPPLQLGPSSLRANAAQV
jgi:hypothetical protein